jgi:hypothetical protein
LVIAPFSHQFVAGVRVGVGALAVLLAEHPPSGIDIFVCVAVGPLAVLNSVFPLAWMETKIP